MKKKIHLYKAEGVHIGAHAALTDEQVRSIVDCLHTQKVAPLSALGGRGSTFATTIPVWGRIVVKHYRRGGLLGKLIESRYLRCGEVRAESEYRLLRRVRELGIRAPEPLAYASRGSLFYRNWLITREIQDSRSLAELAMEKEDDAIRLTKRAVEPVLKLIAHNICHVDLHPGNVLVGGTGELYLLDFDKAYYFKGSQRSLRDFYLRRWRRAVIKHQLPEALSEVMCLKLRSVAV